MRRKRMPFWKIAAKVGLSRATAARIGKARGLSPLSALEPEKPVIRYEKEAPGDMIHIDIKRLAVSKASGIARRATVKVRPIPEAANRADTDGNISISPSTITHDWPIRKYCPTKNANPACAFCSTPCASLGATASKSIAS